MMEFNMFIYVFIISAIIWFLYRVIKDYNKYKN